MAFEKIYLLAKLELDVIATAAGTVTIQSDIPGNAMADRATVTVPICTRRVVSKRLPYQLQGHLFKFSYAPGSSGTSRLYGVRVWGRELPTGMWQWYKLPVVDTPDGWSSVRLEIPPTPESWSSVRIEIPPTSETWNQMAIEIPPTPETWGSMNLPFKPTPPLPEWISLEIDQ